MRRVELQNGSLSPLTQPIPFIAKFCTQFCVFFFCITLFPSLYVVFLYIFPFFPTLLVSTCATETGLTLTQRCRPLARERLTQTFMFIYLEVDATLCLCFWFSLVVLFSPFFFFPIQKKRGVHTGWCLHVVNFSTKKKKIPSSHIPSS